MGWVKEANKIGRYHTTYKGFRLYYTRIRIFAIDKNGCSFESQKLEAIGFLIDKELINRYYDKNILSTPTPA